MSINTSMMQNFGLEDLSHVQSRRNLLKYLVRAEMASDWFTRIYRSILAEEINIQNRDMACKLGCGLLLSPQQILDIKRMTSKLSPNSTELFTSLETNNHNDFVLIQTVKMYIYKHTYILCFSIYTR